MSISPGQSYTLNPIIPPVKTNNTFHLENDFFQTQVINNASPEICH